MSKFNYIIAIDVVLSCSSGPLSNCTTRGAAGSLDSPFDMEDSWSTMIGGDPNGPSPGTWKLEGGSLSGFLYPLAEVGSTSSHGVLLLLKDELEKEAWPRCPRC